MKNTERIQKLVAKKLEEKFGRETMQKIDDKNKNLPPENDSIYNFVKPEEYQDIFKEACDDLGLNWHKVEYLIALIDLRNDGYLRK